LHAAGSAGKRDHRHSRHAEWRGVTQEPDARLAVIRAGGQARNRFLECKTFIEANAIKMRSLDEICRTLHVDPSNLSRLFRRFQGGSPYQYLLRCRMNRAAHEFMSPSARVKEVAARLGYDDPYHFSRLFKAVHGIPPAAFRSLYG